jgi:hypothetical protein
MFITMFFSVGVRVFEVNAEAPLQPVVDLHLDEAMEQFENGVQARVDPHCPL